MACESEKSSEYAVLTRGAMIPDFLVWDSAKDTGIPPLPTHH